MGVWLLMLAAGCSREQQDWRSAEAADTMESYGQFIERHPESELATQARLRVTQLGEDQDWQQAGSADTAEAYRQFLAQHPSGKWAQEARIRIENFSLGAQPEGAISAAPAAQPAQPRTGPDQGTALIAPGDAAVPGAAVPGDAAVQPQPERTAAARASTPVAGSSSVAGAAVQLGAFSSEAGANNEWRVLTGRFGPELQGLSAQVAVADTPSGRLYRLQARVADEPHARALCDELKKHAQGCIAVLRH